MAASSHARVSKRRANLRAAGLRPIQIWVPDSRAPGFAAECHRQAALAAANDCREHGLADLLDLALDDLEGGAV